MNILNRHRMIAISALALLAVLGLVCIGAAADDADASPTSGELNYVSWEINDDTLRIYCKENANGIGNMDDFGPDSPLPWTGLSFSKIVIEYGVYYIGSYSFANCVSVKSVTLPDYVTYIGEAAFYGCTSLESVTVKGSYSDEYVGDNVYLWHQAFYGCTSLKSVQLPSTVTVIEDEAFKFCTSLESIELSDKIKEISDEAFRYCTLLKSVDFGNGLECIGYLSFANCHSLASVNIPDSVKEIGGLAFEYCYSLKTVEIGKGLEASPNNGVMYPSTTCVFDAFFHCTSLEKFVVSEENQSLSSTDGVLFNKNQKELIQYPSNKPGESYAAPESVESVHPMAFFGLRVLKSLTFGDNVSAIEDYAFEQSSSLEEVCFGNGIGKIPNRAFLNCVSLKTVTFPDNLSAIGFHAFEGCKSLNITSIPTTVTDLGPYAFMGCSSLETFVLDCDLSNPAVGTFKNCTSLKDVIIAGDVHNLNEGTFYGCVSLETVKIDGPVYGIDGDAFDKCTSLREFTVTYDDCPYLSVDGVLTTKQGEIVKYPAQKTDANYTIPLGIRTIISNAFEGCEYLTSVKISKDVQWIDPKAFNGCSSLKEFILEDDIYMFTVKDGVLFNDDETELIQYPIGKEGKEYTIPEDVITIKKGAFKGSSLESITIPESVMFIENNAFEGCASLKTVHIPGMVINIGSDQFSTGFEVFKGCESLTEITVDENNPVYSAKDGVLYDENVSYLIHYPEAKPDTEYTLPKTVVFNNPMEPITLLGSCLNLLNVYVEEGSVYGSEKGCLTFDGVMIYCPAGRTDVVTPTDSTVNGLCFTGGNIKTATIYGDSLGSIDDFVGSLFVDCVNLKTIILDKKAETAVLDMTYSWYHDLFISFSDDSYTGTVEIVASEGFRLPDNAIAPGLKFVYTAVNYDEETKELQVNGNVTEDKGYEATANVSKETQQVTIGFDSPEKDDKTSVTVSKEACETLFPEDSMVSFSAKDVTSTVDEETRNKIGNATVFDLSLTVNGEKIHEFGGKVTVTLPYTLKDGESPEDVKAYFVGDDGNIVLIGGTYADGYVTFETDHLSYYAITGENLLPEDGSSHRWLLITVVVVSVLAAIAVAVRKQ